MPTFVQAGFARRPWLEFAIVARRGGTGAWQIQCAGDWADGTWSDVQWSRDRYGGDTWETGLLGSTYTATGPKALEGFIASKGPY